MSITRQNVKSSIKNEEFYSSNRYHNGLVVVQRENVFEVVYDNERHARFVVTRPSEKRERLKYPLEDTIKCAQ